MEIFINGYRITVTASYVNRYKNDPANCPLCKGKLWKPEKFGGKCVIGHPDSFYPSQWQKPDSIPDGCIPYSENDPFQNALSYETTTKGEKYRRDDDKQFLKLKRLQEELKLENDLIEIIPTIPIR